MIKILEDPRLPIAVLRAAILDTFVALSDKWIFEVCCHASSQGLRCQVLTRVMFPVLQTGLKSTSCSIIKIVELWICPTFVKNLNLDQNNSAGDMPRTSVLGRLDCSLPRVGVLIELSVSHISYRQRLLQHQD